MLRQDEHESLSQPLSAEEFAEAIAATQPGKDPGPDGFTLAYYKTFQSQLIPYFLEGFNAIKEDQSIPSELIRANISVNPKPKTRCQVPSHLAFELRR